MLEIRDRVTGLAVTNGWKVAARLGHDSPVVRWTRSAYLAALNWMASERGVNWSINGVNYRIDIRNPDVRAHHYELPVAAFLRKLVKPGFICFDVGANVGLYVLQLCHWSGPSGRVVAFEPNPDARKVLERHVGMNRFQNRVRIIPAALGATESHATFFAAGADGMSRLGKPNPAVAKESCELSVPVMTLDGFVRTGHVVPDLVLIDVEGFELEVLQGARETIKARRGNVHFVVEMHPSLWTLANDVPNRMAAILKELKLRPRCLTGQSDPLAEYGLVYLEYNEQA